MEITFTKEQHENLIKLVYLGSWMVNSIREDKGVKKFDDLEQYIYSFAKAAGMGKLIEYDPETKQYFPTFELEEDAEVEQYRQEYDDYNFWEELTYALARRDFIKEYGENAIKKMSMEERFEKEQPFIEKYEEEFEKYGIERLKIER